MAGCDGPEKFCARAKRTSILANVSLVSLSMSASGLKASLVNFHRASQVASYVPVCGNMFRTIAVRMKVCAASTQALSGSTPFLVSVMANASLDICFKAAASTARPDRQCVANRSATRATRSHTGRPSAGKPVSISRANPRSGPRSFAKQHSATFVYSWRKLSMCVKRAPCRSQTPAIAMFPFFCNSFASCFTFAAACAASATPKSSDSKLLMKMSSTSTARRIQSEASVAFASSSPVSSAAFTFDLDL